jgi:N-acetylglucosaminyl-diphospho-decaprenol L-rhamnosyltransferase
MSTGRSPSSTLTGWRAKRALPHVHDLAVIVVSTNEAHWLEPCLSTVLAHQGDCTLEIVVADNESTDGTRETVEAFAPHARVVPSVNKGFAHANNRALLTTDARYVLFLNPDTEIVEGTFGALVQALDARPSVGLAGVRQLTEDGLLYPTIRRFPSALTALGQALLPERLPGRPAAFGERELDLTVYDEEIACDWTSGSFMFARREALESAGYLDERFFIYSEEPDLCLRMKKAGWEVRHLPLMTIVHHAGKGGVSPRMAAQDAFTRVQYARKHFSQLHRTAYLGALGLGYFLRAFAPGGVDGSARRASNRAALRTLLGIADPPFGDPPPQALASRSARQQP